MVDQAVQRRITIATLIWMSSVALSRATGFLREFIIARTQGANPETDIYYAAFTVPDFLNYLLAGGAISITFIPVFSAYMSRNDEEGAWQAFSVTISAMAVLLVTFIVAGEIFALPLGRLVAPGLKPWQIEKLAHYTRILLPAQFFFVAGGILSAVQLSKDRHALPAMAPLIYNAGIICLGLVLGPHIGMAGFCYGALLGAAVGNFLLQVYGAALAGCRFSFSLRIRHPGFIQFVKLAIPIMIGQSIVLTDEWITRVFASALIAASISWLSYSRTLMRVVPAIFGQAAGIASFPSLSRMHAEGRHEEFVSTLEGSLKQALVLSVMASAAVFVFSPEIIYVVYCSRAFTTADVEQTTAALRMFSLGVFAWSAQAILSRGFYAMADTLTPVLLGTAVTAVSIPLFKVLGNALNHSGLALASSIAIIAYSGVLYVLLLRKIRRRFAVKIPRQKGFILFLGKLLIAGAGAAVLTYLLFLNPTFLASLRLGFGAMRVAAGSLAYLGLFAGLSYLVNLSEFLSALKAVRDKLKL